MLSVHRVTCYMTKSYSGAFSAPEDLRFLYHLKAEFPGSLSQKSCWTSERERHTIAAGRLGVLKNIHILMVVTVLTHHRHQESQTNRSWTKNQNSLLAGESPIAHSQRKICSCKLPWSHWTSTFSDASPSRDVRLSATFSHPLQVGAYIHLPLVCTRMDIGSIHLYTCGFPSVERTAKKGPVLSISKEILATITQSETQVQLSAPVSQPQLLLLVVVVFCFVFPFIKQDIHARSIQKFLPEHVHLTAALVTIFEHLEAVIPVSFNV